MTGGHKEAVVMFPGQWALITGASRGMGAEFASILAERGFNLILAARSVDRLEAVAKSLSHFGVQVHIEQSDLSQPGSAFRLLEKIRARDLRLDLLVNNAGHGLHGDFIDRSGEEINRMLQLNIASLTTLTHSIATDMAKSGSGRILLVASLTAFMPSPTYAAYAATKAYVRHLGEALNAEMAGRNVVITVLSPGLMDTGFLSAAGQASSNAMKRTMTSPRMAAEAGLNALFAGRQTVVAGRMNQIVAIASRLIPRKMQTRIMASALNS